MPRAFTLGAIPPNPSDGPVSIEYALPRATVIDLSVHDLMGREVARIVKGFQTEGTHVAHWTGEVRGARASPGVYFIRLSWPDGLRSRRILVRR